MGDLDGITEARVSSFFVFASLDDIGLFRVASPVNNILLPNNWPFHRIQQ